MKLTDNQHKLFKWLVAVVLPAFITLIGVILTALDVPNADTWLTILVGVETFLGTIFKHAEYQYDKRKDEYKYDYHS